MAADERTLASRRRRRLLLGAIVAAAVVVAADVSLWRVFAEEDAAASSSVAAQRRLIVDAVRGELRRRIEGSMADFEVRARRIEADRLLPDEGLVLIVDGQPVLPRVARAPAAAPSQAERLLAGEVDVAELDAELANAVVLVRTVRSAQGAALEDAVRRFLRVRAENRWTSATSAVLSLLVVEALAGNADVDRALLRALVVEGMDVGVASHITPVAADVLVARDKGELSEAGVRALHDRLLQACPRVPVDCSAFEARFGEVLGAGDVPAAGAVAAVGSAGGRAIVPARAPRGAEAAARGDAARESGAAARHDDAREGAREDDGATRSGGAAGHGRASDDAARGGGDAAGASASRDVVEERADAASGDAARGDVDAAARVDAPTRMARDDASASGGDVGSHGEAARGDASTRGDVRDVARVRGSGATGGDAARGDGVGSRGDAGARGVAPVRGDAAGGEVRTRGDAARVDVGSRGDAARASASRDVVEERDAAGGGAARGDVDVAARLDAPTRVARDDASASGGAARGDASTRGDVRDVARVRSGATGGDAGRGDVGSRRDAGARGDARGDVGSGGDVASRGDAARGDVGSRGDAARGDVGARGVAPTRGDAASGDAGARGAPPVRGDAGARGDARGDVGSRGDAARGDAGARGAPPVRGDGTGDAARGDVGARGAPPVRGDGTGDAARGDVGARGDAPMRGDAARGDVGARGDAGARGRAMYLERTGAASARGVFLDEHALQTAVANELRARLLLGAGDDAEIDLVQPANRGAIPLDEVEVRLRAPRLDAAVADAAVRFRAKSGLLAVMNLMALALASAFVVDGRRRRRYDALRAGFIAAVSHELRTPLASMRLLVDSMLPRADDKTTQKLDRLAHDVDGLDFLVENVLSFSRLERGRLEIKRERVSLAEVAADAVERAKSGGDGGAVIQVDVEDDAVVEGDPELLGIVVANLARNAWHHNPAADKRVAVRVSRGRVVVEDNGPGVPAADQERIFREFERGQRAPSRGTGLGLALCRQIARAHGGDVVLAKTGAGGSTFELTVPVKTGGGPQ